ncbi:GIP, partial [Symbiodinium sp. CCMP2456]
MSADGQQQAPLRDSGQVDGLGPPPGFDVGDVYPAAPDAPPAPVFGQRPSRQSTSLPDSDAHSSSYDQRHTADNTRDWSDRWQSQGGDQAAQSWGNGWDKTGRWENGYQHGDHDRRGSWEASTAADSHRGGQWKPDDPWSDGRDPWSQGDHRDGWRRPHGDQGWHDPYLTPAADGRAGGTRGSDHGDHHRGQWNNGTDGAGQAWNGWSYFDNGGFQANVPSSGRATNGPGRASEKLAVPSFAGEDSEDLGGSTRSYLRQIEAWRRMTYLPESQQGLVLYQSLTGKAWVAAEELSVSRLGSNGGVEYFVAWLNARFLDLEVARVGRAFSDFFRKLRRRNGQSIREYNSEYDRLHARHREVGCCLPQECAAWLYVDRLQLDEPQELNLLASVGNQYNLLKLQQAAVLHDRGHRKPWESKAKRPYTAHLTEDADGDDDGEDRDEIFDHFDGDEGIPEEVAVAYATYQSAKDKYREQEKIKLMKDPECPNRGAKEVDMCHHVPSEVYVLRHDGPILVGITDTSCAKSVAGTTWLQHYSDLVKDSLGKPEFVRESEAFKFGTGKAHHSAFYVLVKFRLGDKIVEMKTSITNGDIPLLLSKGALAQLGMVYDVAANRASFHKVGLMDFDLVTTSSGHPAIPITPPRSEGDGAKLVISDSAASIARAYLAFADMDAPCKPPPITKMTKVQLLEECTRVGLVVHRNWSIEEIKAVIQEHRMANSATSPSYRMKSITNLTLPEPKMKADELGVLYPAKIAKGNLLRLVRDHVATPATELMKIGRYTGWEYGEIPRQYGMWAAREIRMNGNPHPELVRFAQWWENKEHETHYGTSTTFEENATVPYQPENETVSEAQSSRWSGSKVGYSPEREARPIPPKGYPIPPKVHKRTSPSTGSHEEMEAEIDPRTLEEIQQLEARLAILKDKAKTRALLTTDFETTDFYTIHASFFPDKENLQACCSRDDYTIEHNVFITEKELFDGQQEHHLNYACSIDPHSAEDLFVQAIADCDYSEETLKKLLDGIEFPKVKTTRDEVFGEHGARMQYRTFGLYSHGGTFGVTTNTKQHGSMVCYLNEFARRRLGKDATWTSVTVGRNAGTQVHHDFHNLKASRNYTISLGQRAGGEIWLEDRAVEEGDIGSDVKWRRAGTGHWLPGRIHDTNGKFYEFDPFLKHATEPWTGDRWSLTFHSTRNYPKVSLGMKSYLRNCGFPLPKTNGKGRFDVDEKQRPKRSTRKALFNNAARISVMMASFICAAGNYMNEHFYPQVDYHPIVMFEVGGTEATEEAADLSKDVFEPMSWETYRSPEGKETAYHIINGGTPRELRLHLEGKGAQCHEALAELIQQQLDENGTVEYTQYYQEKDGKFFLVLFKSNPDGIIVEREDRAHEVCMVGTGNGDDPGSEIPVLGADGITFSKETPGRVATALRRLHQNLGHPQLHDFVRHLRLAGCEAPVLKAARSMRCQVCEASAGPKVARPSTVPVLHDWNDTLGIDLFFAHDINDQKHTFLSVVGYGTTYHLAARLDGQGADDIEAKFNEMWVLPFGPPKTVVADLEGGPQVALARLCDWHNIGVRNVATQSHWQAGMVERQQAWWKSIWERVTYQMSVGEDEVDLATSTINSAKNDLRRKCGYSPSQWVFGKAPRLPEDLRDPDGGEGLVWDVTQVDQRLQKALLQRQLLAFQGGPMSADLTRARATYNPEEVGSFLTMNSRDEVEKLLEYDPDDPDVFEDEEDEDMPYDPVDDVSVDYEPIEMNFEEGEGEAPILEPMAEDDLRPPLRRLKRKTNPSEMGQRDSEVWMLRSDLTRRGVEQRKEKELKWSEIPEEAHQKFREAEEVQWREHLSYDALQPLTLEESNAVRARVPPNRVLRSRWAYKDKNYACRRDGEDVPWKCKSRLVIAGHMDPDLGTERLCRGAALPAFCKQCAFLTGSYLSRELYMHQPRTGFPGMSPGELVKIKKNVFGLATSPHEWWNDLRSSITAIQIPIYEAGKKTYYQFDQCPLDPCVFALRKWENGNFVGKPVAFMGCHVDDLLIAAPGLGDGRFRVLFQLDIPGGAKDDEVATDELISDNRSLIGALSWMSSTSRPDLTCSVSMAQQLQKQPTYADLRFTNATAAKALLYKNHGLTFRYIPPERMMIIVYHDAAWANVPEPDPEEDYYILTPEEDRQGLQTEGPFAEREGKRKAKKGNSKVASQLGILVTFADRGCLSGEAGNFSVADWKSRAGQRVCRLVTVEQARMPLLCL